MPTIPGGIYTFEFPIRKIKTGDRLKIKIRFAADGPELNNIVYDTDAAGCFIEGFEDAEWSYDIKETMFVPGRASFKFSDLQGALRDFLFNYSNVNKDNILVTVEIRHADLQWFRADWDDDAEYHPEFSGVVIYDSIKASPAINISTVEFTASAQTDLLNKQRLYSLDDDALDPLVYLPSDPLVQENMHQNRELWVGLKDLIEDIYAFVNSSITVEFGSWNTTQFVAMPFGAGSGDIVTDLDSLEINVYRYFFDSTYGLSTLADVLRRVAFGFNAYTGMMTQDRAFFRQQFKSNDDPVQIVNPVTLEPSYKENKIDYVRITQSTKSGLYIPPGSNEGSYDVVVTLAASAGAETQIEGKFIDETTDVFVPGNALSGEFAGLTGSNLRVYSETDLIYKRVRSISQMVSSDPEVWENDLTSAEWIAKFWHRFRSTDEGSRVDAFVLPFLRYDFLADFAYQGKQYHPVRLQKNYEDGVTELEVIIVGAADTSVVVPTIPNNPTRDFGNGEFGTELFTPGLFGSGWKIVRDQNGKYRLEIDKITVRGSLTVSELLFMQKRTFNGSLIVGRTSTGKPVSIVKLLE